MDQLEKSPPSSLTQLEDLITVEYDNKGQIASISFPSTFTIEEARILREIMFIQLSTIYDDFLESLKRGSLGCFMIEGILGELKRNHYRSFYTFLLTRRFCAHFTTLSRVFRVYPQAHLYIEFMRNIFPQIYQNYIKGMAFVGSSYITHTPCIAFSRDYLLLVKTIHKPSVMCGYRRLIAHSFNGQNFGPEFSIFEEEGDDIEVIGVVSSSLSILCFDSQHHIYILTPENHPNQPCFQRLIEPNLHQKCIKGMFGGNIITRMSEVFFVLTSEGQVFVKGRCGKLLGSQKSDDKVINVFKLVIYMDGQEVLPKIVDIQIHPALVRFIDENNVSYRYRYNGDMGLVKESNLPKNELYFHGGIGGTDIYSLDVALTVEKNHILLLDGIVINPYSHRINFDFMSPYMNIPHFSFPNQVLLYYISKRNNDDIHIFVTEGGVLHLFIEPDDVGDYDEEDDDERDMKPPPPLIQPNAILYLKSKNDLPEKLGLQCSYCEKRQSSMKGGGEIKYDLSQCETFCGKQCQESYYENMMQYLLKMRNNTI